MAVAVIIDIVDSRSHPDQLAVLAGVAQRVGTQLVHIGGAASAGATVGDEFQAIYDDDAAMAVLDLARLRLSLLVDPPGQRPVEVRAGIGVGEVIGEGRTATAPGQSGSAWWRAREALDEVARDRNAWPVRRWWVVGDDTAALAASLVALDTLAARFDAVDAHAALLLLDGVSAADIAVAVDLQPSSLSARLHRRGVYGWVRTLEVLTGAVAWS